MNNIKEKNDTLVQVILNVIMFAGAVICLYPVILTLIVSFSSEMSVVKNGYQLIPEEFSLVSYKLVFQDKSIYSAYGITILVTVVGTLMSLIICGMAGYALSIQRVKYKNQVSMFFYIPMVFSAGLLPWYLICTQVLKLTDTIWALILPMLVSPFNVFLMRNYFKTIPASLVESAEIDGCNIVKTFFLIVLPLSTPILATVSLFIGLGYWNDWSLALWFISDKSLYPLQYMLYKIQSVIDFIRQNGSMGNVEIPAQTFQIATLFITIGPIILLYPFVQKYFVKGIMVGAVKG